VIGIGLGGFFDGIVLHQILQWHHLVSNLVPVEDVEALRLNTLVDGLFHQAMWVVAVVGLFLLYTQLVDPRRDERPPLLGGILLGWGAFNVFDSVVSHWVLNLHNIRPGPDAPLYDLAFFAWGIAMIAAGSWLIRTPRRTRTGGQTVA
jgi:uncharacterized membrane protein